MEDVDWLVKLLSIERGVVKQIEDEVKTKTSAKKMVIDDDLLDVLSSGSKLLSSRNLRTGCLLHLSRSDGNRSATHSSAEQCRHESRHRPYPQSCIPPHLPNVVGFCRHACRSAAETHASR